jgi:hypothetical protein
MHCAQVDECPDTAHLEERSLDMVRLGRFYFSTFIWSLVYEDIPLDLDIYDLRLFAEELCCVRISLLSIALASWTLSSCIFGLGSI